MNIKIFQTIVSVFILSSLFLSCDNKSSSSNDKKSISSILLQQGKQQTITNRKVISICQMQKFILNSKTNIGGKDKTVYVVDLPPNTIEWYYSIRTSAPTDKNLALNLSTQIAALAINPDIDPSKIKIPAGTGRCDMYLFLDRENADNFEAEKSFQHDKRYSRENFSSGVVKILNPQTNRFYLGFKNPRSLHAVCITLDIVAIVKQ